MSSSPTQEQEFAPEPFFTHALGMLAIASMDGYFVRLSPEFERLGYSREELCSRPFIEFVHPQDREATLQEVAKLAGGRPTVAFENRYRCKDGSYLWLHWCASPDPSGALYAVAHDVTERQRAMTRLKRVNQFLEAVLENIPHMVFVKDAERLAFVRLNRAGEELLGLKQEALVGKSDADFFSPELAAAFQAKDRETLQKGELVDILVEPVETPHGTRLLHTKKVPLRDEDGRPAYLLGISEDITDRRAQELAVARLAAIVDDSVDAIVSTTLDDRVATWNGGAQRIFGFTAAEMEGRALSELCPERLRAEAAETTARVLAGEEVETFETARVRKDGVEIDVSLTVSPLRDRTGQVIGVSEIARDISEDKRLRQELQSAIERAEAANRELESFSYSVAHDLRTPLRSIDGFSQALLEDCGEDLNAAGKRYLGLVCDSARLMGQLIDDLLVLSQVSRAELVREDVDVAAVAREAAERCRRSDPARAVEIRVEEGLRGHADRRLLAVVLDNLLGNAWKFTREAATPRIEVGRGQHEGHTAFFIRDNGAGFDMDYVHKLFGAFQRLHSASEFEGTGIGLATVKRVVKRHGGKVWAVGEPGAGATFWFSLEGEGHTHD